MSKFSIALVFLFVLGACKNNKSSSKQATVKPYPVITLQPKSAVINSDYPATIMGVQILKSGLRSMAM